MHWGRGKMHPGDAVVSVLCLNGRRTGTDNTKCGKNGGVDHMEWAASVGGEAWSMRKKREREMHFTPSPMHHGQA